MEDIQDKDHDHSEEKSDDEKDLLQVINEIENGKHTDIFGEA